MAPAAPAAGSEARLASLLGSLQPLLQSIKKYEANFNSDAKLLLRVWLLDSLQASLVAAPTDLSQLLTLLFVCGWCGCVGGRVGSIASR